MELLAGLIGPATQPVTLAIRQDIAVYEYRELRKIAILWSFVRSRGPNPPAAHAMR